jgi:hypothetical protein
MPLWRLLLPQQLLIVTTQIIISITSLNLINKPWVGQQKAGGPETTGSYDPDSRISEPCGVLRPIASRILMKILYAAGMCRYDLLRAVCGLAICIAKWTQQCERDLRRVICYINATQYHKMIGWCGDSADALELKAYADADFAGCVRTLRSTTGVTLAVEGPNSKMILNAVSKRQTVVSHSTPEAEIVAADCAMRQEGMPTLALLSAIVGREVTLSMMEDNEAVIAICYCGKNPTMRYLNRTRKVGIFWLMEVSKLPDLKLYKIDIKLQAADIGTQRITCI